MGEFKYNKGKPYKLVFKLADTYSTIYEISIFKRLEDYQIDKIIKGIEFEYKTDMIYLQYTERISDAELCNSCTEVRHGLKTWLTRKSLISTGERFEDTTED